MLQPGTCYARPIYPQMNTCRLYKVHFELLYKGIRARKHARSPVPRGARPRWSVPRLQRWRMKRSCYRWKVKERTGHRKSSIRSVALFLLHDSSRSCSGVQRFVDDEGRCSGPMQNYSSLLLLQSDNRETMPFLLVAISRGGLCNPSRPTAYPHMGVHICFPINITASEVLPPK